MFQNIGEILVLFWRTLQALPLCWRNRKKIAFQLFEIGNVSLLMVCILSLFIAGVTALQTGPVLVERGLGSVLGGMIGLSMCKEFAPVMMAILIAGRVGSAMAAEIGANLLVIATAVEKVCLNFGKPNQRSLDAMTLTRLGVLELS